MSPHFHQVDLDVEQNLRTVLIASREGVDCGSVQLSHQGKLVADLCMLFVNPDHRRQGLARALLSECERIAKLSGCKGVALSVQVHNQAARSLYTAEGYVTGFQYQSGDLLMFKTFTA